MISNKGAKEQIQLHASAVIVRESNKGTELLVIENDKPKIEVAAGFKHWSKPQKDIWSTPGGMRLVASGEPQTREKVLQQSLLRETGLLVSLQELSQGKIQDYPFLLGRRHTQIIEQAAATSALFYIDQLAEEYQRYIGNKIREGKAVWYSLAQIVAAFSSTQLKKGRRPRSGQSELDFRQHVYTSAYLWSLNLTQGWSDEAVLREVNRINIKTGRFIDTESRKNKVPLGQSIFGGKHNNVPPYLLSAQVRDFLFKLPAK